MAKWRMANGIRYTYAAISCFTIRYSPFAIRCVQGGCHVQSELIEHFALTAMLAASIASRRPRTCRNTRLERHLARRPRLPVGPDQAAGSAQQAPLTPEYQKIFEDSLKARTKAARATTCAFTCMPSGMPRTMTVLFQIEFVIAPATTYLMFSTNNPVRRIYTDGGDWPKDEEPSFTGYSIGKWSIPTATASTTRWKSRPRNTRATAPMKHWPAAARG